jgi:hypothetical protein
MKSAMHPANEVVFSAQVVADPAAGGQLHRLTDSELLEHMCALSIAVAYNQSNAAQLALQLAQQLHGLAVEHDFLKICRLLNAYDFTAAQFMLQHLQDQLRI